MGEDEGEGVWREEEKTNMERRRREMLYYPSQGTSNRRSGGQVILLSCSCRVAFVSDDTAWDIEHHGVLPLQVEQNLQEADLFGFLDNMCHNVCFIP